MARYNSATRAEEPTSTLSSFTVLQLLASILTCLPMKYILFLPHLAESDDTVSAQTPPLRRRTHTGLVRSQSDGPFRGPFVRSGAVVSTCREAAHTTRQGGHAALCVVWILCASDGGLADWDRSRWARTERKSVTPKPCLVALVTLSITFLLLFFFSKKDYGRLDNGRG